MVELDQLAVGVESHSNGVYEVTVDEVRQSFSDRLSKGQLPAEVRASDTEFQVRRFIAKFDHLENEWKWFRPYARPAS